MGAVKRAGTFFFFALTFFALFPETPKTAAPITPRTVFVVEMDALEPVRAVLQLGDALRIVLPAERKQLQSIEVEIRVPAVLAAAKDAAAFAFYDDTTLAELYKAPLPNRVGVNLAVPYGSFVPAATPYALAVPVRADEKTGALFLHLSRAGAVSAEAEAALIYVTVKPHVEDRGFLDWTIRLPPASARLGAAAGGTPQPPGALFLLYVDEKPVGAGAGETGMTGRMTLDSGVHHLSLVSDFFRNELRTFIIERGKASRLEIELRDISPTLVVAAPEHVEVLLDERPILPGSPGTGNTPLLLTAGDHVIRVTISGYEILRTLHAENGRSYRVAIRLDLDVQELR